MDAVHSSPFNDKNGADFVTGCAVFVSPCSQITQRLSHRRTNEQPVTQTTGINISYISQQGESLPAACQEITSRQCTKQHNTHTVLNMHVRETEG